MAISISITDFLIDRMRSLLSLSRASKRAIVIGMDVVLCMMAVWLSFSIRLGGWELLSPRVVLVTLATLVFWFLLAWHVGVYNAIFRYSGSGTIVNLATAILGVTLPLTAVFLFYGIATVPRTVSVLVPIIFFMLLALSRIVARYVLVDLLAKRQFSGERRRTMIWGAGEAGQELAASVNADPSMELVGFIDDDIHWDGQLLGRRPVFHSSRMRDVIIEGGVDDVLLALPTASWAQRKKIVHALEQLRVRVRTLPAMREIVDGSVSVSSLREVAIEDVLGREPVPPVPELLSRTITDKVVMVTGAGGSIGSELCRQIIRLAPRKLIMVEMSEYALYAIDAELRQISQDERLAVPLVPELLTVVNRDGILRAMEAQRPHTVFHAAAYKHVPLVEANVVSGARNNILGTYNTADAARACAVETFLLVSTDKAVRPTNVMGTTKRVCELIVQALATQESGTVFASVRFGNVLGSSGSVVPVFKRQIRQGGPVTVTDRRITRFFMTIAEASQLVIQASGMATGGEVYVLDMGKPIRILDLAKTMIRLSGMTVRDEENPDGDIEIRETGLRPGEKLFEELLIGNNPSPTGHTQIMQAREHMLPYAELLAWIGKLERTIAVGDRDGVRRLLSDAVTEYAVAVAANDANVRGAPGAAVAR